MALAGAVSEVSAATKGSFSDAGHILPSAPAWRGTEGTSCPPFLPGGLWDDKEPTGQVLSLWVGALRQ